MYKTNIIKDKYVNAENIINRLNLFMGYQSQIIPS